jgi:uncharacterized protein YjcR
MKKPPAVPLDQRAAETKAKCGAPFGNRNALVHGRFAREQRALETEVRAHLREGKTLIETFARPSRPIEGG